MVGCGLQAIGSRRNLIHLTQSIEVLRHLGAGGGQIVVEDAHPSFDMLYQPLLIGGASIGNELSPILGHYDLFLSP